MMNRTITFLVILLVLLVAFLVVVPKKRTADTLSIGEDRLFAVKEVDQIERIFLAGRDGNKTDLTWNGSYWVFNGKYKANKNAVQNLLDAVTRVQMKYKPADAAVDGMVRSLSSEGIKVEIFGPKNKPLKTYYVGGATVDERGTYMIMEGANQPYVCSIPGWEGNLRFRFSLRDDQWRDKTVFSTKLEDIKAVSVEYPKQKNRSFRIGYKSGAFQLSPFYDITPVPDKPIIPGTIEQFLTQFEHLVAESFDNKNPLKDSISQRVPFCIVTLETKGDLKKSVAFHPIFPEVIYVDSTKPQGKSNPPVERFFVDSSNGDFMLVQNRLFKRIFWGYDFFYDSDYFVK